MSILNNKYVINFCVALFTGLLFSLTAIAEKETPDVNVMTFNLRVPVDPFPYDWASREARVLAIIQSRDPDFLGLQEAVLDVLQNLDDNLAGYARIGRGRNADGLGEFTAIFYKSALWKIDDKDQGTLQLSPTPDVPGSNGWHMQWLRIFTWARFIERRTGRALYVFNTHFPLRPEERDLSIRVLAKYISERKHKTDPVILMGDFNATETEDAIQYVLGKYKSPIAMADSYRILHPNKFVTSFQAFGKDTEIRKIDYIFIQGNVRVLASEIIDDAPNYASDHFAVVAKLRLGTVKK